MVSGGNEIDEIAQRMGSVIVGVIQATGQLAQTLVQLRVEALRRAAAAQHEQSQAIRAQMRAWQQADAAVWRAAMRPGWWRQAGVEDVARVWRAASTWSGVDPYAAEARQVVVERMADRGVHIDPTMGPQWSAEYVAWLSDAVDRAAADRASTKTATPRGATSEQPAAAHVIDGEVADRRDESDGEQVGEAAASAEAAQVRAQQTAKAEAHVRAVYDHDRAERVVGCQAWGALVYLLAQAEQEGQNVRGLLRGVPDFVDRARTPAAFAYRTIEDRLAGRVDLGTARRDDRASGRAADLRDVASAARVDGDAHHGREADWREGAETAPTRVGEAHAQSEHHAGVVSDRQADAAAADAARVAAEGFPTSTGQAVASAFTRDRRGTPGSRAAAKTVAKQRESRER